MRMGPQEAITHPEPLGMETGAQESVPYAKGSAHRPQMRVPPSQGLVRRKTLTQLSRERGGASRALLNERVRMSSGLYAASDCTILKFSSGRGRD